MTGNWTTDFTLDDTVVATDVLLIEKTPYGAGSTKHRTFAILMTGFPFTDLTLASDVILVRDAAAVLQLGRLHATAPTAQAANMLSMNPIEFGSPIVTVEPSVTPRLANSAARRSTRSANSARVSVCSL